MARRDPPRSGARSPAHRCAACKSFAANATAAKHIRPGKQALLASHRALVDGDLDCGFEFDAAFKADYRHLKRSDYLFVRKADCSLVAVEVHEATSTKTIQHLVDKRNGTLAILKKESLPDDIKRWHWVLPAGGKIAFSPDDRRLKAVASLGIRQPRRHVDLGQDER